MEVFAVHINRHPEYFSCLPAGLLCFSVFLKDGLAWILPCLEVLQVYITISKTLPGKPLAIADNSDRCNAAFPLLLSYPENNNSKIQIQRCLIWAAWLVNFISSGKWKCFYLFIFTIWNCCQHLQLLFSKIRVLEHKKTVVSTYRGRMQLHFFSCYSASMLRYRPTFFFFFFVLARGRYVFFGGTNAANLLFHFTQKWHSKLHWQTGNMICKKWRISGCKKEEDWFLRNVAVYLKMLFVLCVAKVKRKRAKSAWGSY